jgi:hypothetical protein
MHQWFLFLVFNGCIYKYTARKYFVCMLQCLRTSILDLYICLFLCMHTEYTRLHVHYFTHADINT